MSKLKNAPLLEVIFEIKWDTSSKQDIIDFQYLHGDLYAHLKEMYPIRENLIPPEVPLEVIRGLPVFRFRKEKGSYPLVQIGLGLLTINTVDDKYYWDDLKNEINGTLKIFSEIYPKIKNLKLTPILTYIDFFSFDKSINNSIDFINSNFSLIINDNFTDISKNLLLNNVNFTLNYKVENYNDIVSINLRDGSVNSKQRTGIIMQTKIVGEKKLYSNETLIKWLDQSHELSSDIFKSITQRKLYATFK